MKPSKRQLELLSLCSEGETIKTAAQAMHISKFTAMQYAVEVKSRLDARTMTQAVAIALRNGYIK